MPPKYLLQHHQENLPAINVRRENDDRGALWTLEELVDLYADEFPDVDDLPDLLTVDDLSELTETFNKSGCVPFLEGVPAMQREDRFRAQIEAVPVGGTLRIQAAVTLMRTE